MSVQPQSYALKGGQDLVSPFLEISPGAVIDALNFEVLPKGGYRRIAGYQGFDGSSVATGGGAPFQAVPGVGPVRTVFTLSGTVYAIRDNVGATAGGLYRADATLRWQLVPMFKFMRFNTASLIPTIGQTVNGQTSGATAVVKKVVFSGGFTDQTSAYGLLVVETVTGTFSVGENLRVATTVYGKVGTVPADITIPVGGSYNVVTDNFYGGTSTRSAYGASGMGFAFEFDGTVYTPIEQGLTIFPTRVASHKKHLFLGYREGSTFNSAIGNPLSYSVLGGAAEIALGDEITELQPLTGGVLMIGCRNKVEILYGNDSTSWQAQDYAQHGVIPNTVSEVANQTILLDSRGVQQLSATQAFGDFESTALSYPVNLQLLTYLTGVAQPFSCVSQNNSQYRIFWGVNGYYFTFDGGVCVGAMPVTLGHAVSCVWEGSTTTGTEMLLFGTEDGKVMLMDQTNFFNGGPIVSRLQLPFGYFGTPTRRKQFKRAVFDARVIGVNATIMGRHQFDLGDSPSSIYNGVTVEAGNNGFWGSSLWNQFQWASPLSTTAVLDLEGLGENLSISIQHAGVEDTRIAFYGVTIHYALRRLSR